LGRRLGQAGRAWAGVSGRLAWLGLGGQAAGGMIFLMENETIIDMENLKKIRYDSNCNFVIKVGFL